jgi:eukaryotic-like serine/threonine-protein kinase
MSYSILIIDDSEDFRMLARQFLLTEWPDANVEEWDPLELGKPSTSFGWEMYDIVLLDYMLGKEDGLVWLKEFRRMPNCPPIIFLTGAGNEDLAVQALKAGASDYLRKHDLSKARLTDATAESIREYRELKAKLDRLGTTWPTKRSRVRSPSQPQLATLPELEITHPLGDNFQTDENNHRKAHNIFINGYRIIRKIGHGGMSTVYLTEKIADDRRVVLKILNAELTRDNDFLKRFIQEYGIISRIQNPYVTKIYDQGFTDEHVYIAMEYFPGGDLRAKISGGVTPTNALIILSHIAQALEAIHTAGVVHRDLKPENIMFRADGTLALLDFGVAKEIGELNDITHHGQVIGTPYYMSPEQGSGRALDHRSDIYSTGIILYEMLTGERPFHAESAVALVYKHLHDEVPRLPGKLREYQELVDRLLAKQPDQRFPDARALLVYLGDRFSAGVARA